jgi:hypothetical protein
VYEDNIARDLSLQELLQVIKDAVALVTEEDWEGFLDIQKQLESNAGKEMGCSRGERPYWH